MPCPVLLRIRRTLLSPGRTERPCREAEGGSHLRRCVGPLPRPIADEGDLEEMLTERRGKRVKVLVPQRGKKRALVDLA